MNLRPSLYLGLLTSTLLGFTAPLQAVDVFWTNPASGNWNEPTNWSTGTVPTSADAARINNGGTAIIDATQSVVTTFAILGAATGESGTLRMTGGTLDTNSDIRVGGNGNGAVAGNGTGLFEQSGGVVNLNGGNLNIGFGVGSVGTYNLSSGSLQVNAGFIMAVGNTGTGVVNQTGGSIYIRSATTPANSVIQLGRNSLTVPSSGTYTLSGGTAAARNFDFGRQVPTSGGASTNTFNLQGTGTLITNGVRIQNTSATNTFNFTGGTLIADSIGLSLTNAGGILKPDFADFSSVPLTIDAIPINRISTMNFTNGSSYTQTANGTLAIDLASTGNDFVSLGAFSPATANLAGTIAVSLLDGFNPAVGSTFDILAATGVTSVAQITGSTASGFMFSPSIVNGDDGRQVLRLTVIPEPGTAGLLAVGLLGAGLRRLRRPLVRGCGNSQ